MRRIIPVVAVLCIVAPAAAAEAGTGCINSNEYDSVHLGYTRSQVEAMIGAKPDYYIQFENAVSTGYNHCGGNTKMMAGFTFKNGTLWRKEWNWREL